VAQESWLEDQARVVQQATGWNKRLVGHITTLFTHLEAMVQNPELVLDEAVEIAPFQTQTLATYSQGGNSVSGALRFTHLLTAEEMALLSRIRKL
jgi:hypothetical protein